MTKPDTSLRGALFRLAVSAWTILAIATFVQGPWWVTGGIMVYAFAMGWRSV